MYRMKSINNNSHRKRDIILTIIASLLFVAFCYMLDAGLVPGAGSYQVRILRLCFVYTILGLSMNLINGFTGQFSLGQPGFMAIGAYVTALLVLSPAQKAACFYITPIVPWLADVQLPFIVALLLGGLAAAFVSFLIGFPVLRLRGDYLAIATLGFSEIIRVMITNAQSVTNGSLGLKGIPSNANIWFTLAAAVLVVIFVVRLMKTSYGRAFKAIRDDDIAAEAMGVSLFKHKLLSFIIGGFLAGIGGGLLASVVGAIDPLQFRFILVYDILLIVVLGGMGSITGTIVAAFIITIAKEYLRFLDNGFDLFFIHVPAISGMRMLVFSVFLMIIILFFRNGIFGSKEFSWQGLFDLIKNIPSRLKALFSRKKGGAKE